MKKMEIYFRFYQWQEEKGSHGHSYAKESEEDTICNDLSKICLGLGRNLNPTAHSIINEKYLFFENLIDPWKNAHPCVCQITVDINNMFQKTPKDHYCRRVEIEIMPKYSATPKELTDLLASKGFEKIKEDSK